MSNQKAGFTQEGSYTPDALHAGDFPIRTRKGTLITGQNLLRGALLGAISIGALTAAGAAGVPAPAGATITASPAAAAGTEIGIHRFVATIGGAGTASKWEHFSPDGQFVGVATGNTEYVGGGLTLTITDTGTDPAAGEAFNVTVTAAAGSGKLKLSLAAATDGSQTPISILAEDTDATAADVECVEYLTGDFNQDALTYGTGHTAASVADGLRDRSIFLHNPVSA